MVRGEILLLFPYDQLIDVAAFIEKASFTHWIVWKSIELFENQLTVLYVDLNIVLFHWVIY